MEVAEPFRRAIIQNRKFPELDHPFDKVYF
jgi:hypothetical protein